MLSELITKVNQKQEEIHQWLFRNEAGKELPLYSSVDIRDSGFKIAAVDTNLFPQGFNNLCEHGIEDSIEAMRKAISERVQGCRNILVIAEEHTRNTFYLENLKILEEIIQSAGFQVKIATFLNIEPKLCQDANYVELESASGKPIRIYSIDRVLKDITAGGMYPCLVIMNNDLTTGIPEILKGTQTPIYPSIQAGWHSRLKSHHFCHTFDLMKEFSDILDFDPWQLTCLNGIVDDVNINEDQDRQRLADAASELLKKIQAKYNEYQIKDKPFIFMKSDSGTYGMGVMSFEDPKQIIDLNRRQKNKMYRGKGSQLITRFLLQEGVPTTHSVEDHVSEVCIYQISNQFVGGFYRIHSEKTERENLNSKGMSFEKMCPHNHQYGDCGIHTDNNMFDAYRILARIAGIAGHREIVHLEKAVNE